MFKFPTKAALSAYIAGTTPKAGIHIVEKDESFYNEKIEYLFKDGTLTRMTNPKIEYIKRNDINTYAELASISSPVNKNMIVVLKDENTYNKTTWYTYNVDAWVLMGEYLGKEIKKAVSAGNTRGSVIAADTDYTIPLEYTYGKQELSIYVEGYKLSSTDFIEVGTDGVLSSKVQFKNAIMVSSEIEYVREVNTNQTIDPSYQIVQQKIQDDTIIRSRIDILKSVNKTYGGTIQNASSCDPSKIYWCDINKKFYRSASDVIVIKTWTVADSDWVEYKLNGVLGFLSCVISDTGVITILESFNINPVKLSEGKFRLNFNKKLPHNKYAISIESQVNKDSSETAYNCRILRGYTLNNEYIDISHGWHNGITMGYTDPSILHVVIKEVQ